MAFTRTDLEKLNTVYWEIERRGKAWEEHAKALSRIYYAAETILNEADATDEAPQPETSEAILIEEATTIMPHKQRLKVYDRVSEMV